MINSPVTKGRTLIGVISKVVDDTSPEDERLRHTGKVRVRIPEFHGPKYKEELPEKFANDPAYWTDEDDLPWIPVCFPLGTSFTADLSTLFKVDEMVYITYTDDKYQSPLVLGTTGRMIDNSLLSEGSVVSTGVDGASPLFNRASPGDKIDVPGATAGLFSIPVAGTYRVSSPYGKRGNSFHYGIDLAASLGTPVVPSLDGVVLNTTGNKYTDNSRNANKGSGTASYGNYITIQHNYQGKVFYTRYAHLSYVNVKQNQTVSQNDVIGQVGSTGNSTGPHLHFEILNGGTVASRSSVNPADYLTGLNH